jgi:serine protease Do
MKMRNLLSFFVIVLVTSVNALAQRTPPAPATPPAPPSAITAPVPPVYSFSLEGASYLGVTSENITNENMSKYGLSAPRGVGVTTVTPNGPADRAGLKNGDVILQFDGEPVTTTRKLARLISEAAPEQAVRLTISRQGSEQQITAKLGQRDASRAFRAAMPPDLNGYFRVNPPNAPRVWGNAPEAYAFTLGNNRRVGINTTPLTKQLAEFFGVSGGRGILITSISDNSPAAKAGLKAGDVITEVNNEKIEDAADFIRALNHKEEGEVTLTIIRDKSQRTIKVTPERRTTAPTINLSELQPLGNVTISPLRLRDLPNFRLLQKEMPRIENFVMPKLDGMNLPRFWNLPREL